MANFGPKPWVNHFGKMSFSWSIMPKKKSWKNDHLWTKTMG